MNFWEIKKKGDLKMVEHLNSKLTINRETPKQSVNNPKCSCVGVDCLVVYLFLF